MLFKALSGLDSEGLFFRTPSSDPYGAALEVVGQAKRFRRIDHGSEASQEHPSEGAVLGDRERIRPRGFRYPLSSGKEHTNTCIHIRTQYGAWDLIPAQGGIRILRAK